MPLPWIRMGLIVHDLVIPDNVKFWCCCFFLVLNSLESFIYTYFWNLPSSSNTKSWSNYEYKNVASFFSPPPKNISHNQKKSSLKLTSENGWLTKNQYPKFNSSPPENRNQKPKRKGSSEPIIIFKVYIKLPGRKIHFMHNKKTLPDY